jgi:hypothetical protein
MTRITVLCVSLFVFCLISCKKKEEIPDPKALIVGNWKGSHTVNKTFTHPSTLTIKEDLSFTILSTDVNSSSAVTLKANGKLMLNGNTLSGPVTLTEGLQGPGFIAFTLSSDHKKVEGYFTNVEGEPNTGNLIFSYTKE